MRGFLFFSPFGMVLVSSDLSFTLKLTTMRGLLYIIAIILVLGWAFGFFYYSAGGIIHVLLVIAIVALLLGVIRRA